MKLTTRLVELGLIICVMAYAGLLTKKWVSAEREASFLRGQFSVFQSFAEDPKMLKKW